MKRKTRPRLFKRQTSEISLEKTWTALKNKNLKRETESILRVTYNNANYVRPKVDKTQQNCRCRLCGENDETINPNISKCRILVQREYKTRHKWVGQGDRLGIVQDV